MSCHKNDLYCINTIKIFDWVVRPIELTLIQFIQASKNSVKDCIKGNIYLPCGDSDTLWKGSSSLQVSGTVTLFHASGCNELEVMINGELAFTIPSGQTRSMTFNNLQSVEVICPDGEGFCLGNYCLDLHYNLCNLPFDLKDCKVVCLLSDAEGTPTESVTCKELSREDIDIRLPDYKVTSLQKVKLIKKGFVTIKFICRDKTVFLCTIPFCFLETFILCAPSETSIDCNVFDFSCKIKLINQKEQSKSKLVIMIHFCQEVKVYSNVTIGIKGDICKPREDSVITEQCPNFIS